MPWTLREKCVIVAERIGRWLDRRPDANHSRTKKAGWCFGGLADFILGNHLQRYPERPVATNGVQSLVALHTALIAGVIGFLAYLQKDPAPSALTCVFYVIISLVPWSCMFAIVRVRSDHTDETGSRTEYAFDRGAIMFARWCLPVSALMIGLVASGAYFRFLPFSKVESKALQASRATPRNYDSGDESGDEKLRIRQGDPGLIAYFPINSGMFTDKRFPDPVTITVEILPAHRAQWQITAFRGVAGGDESTTPSALLAVAPDPPGTEWRIIWPQLITPKTYTLKVFIHQIDKAADREAFMKTITENLDVALRARIHFEEIDSP